MFVIRFKSNEESEAFIEDDIPWDAPLIEYEHKLKPMFDAILLYSLPIRQKTEVGLDVARIIREGLNNQLSENKERQDNVMGNWVGIIHQNEKNQSGGNSTPQSYFYGSEPSRALDSQSSNGRSHIESASPISQKSTVSSGRRPTMVEIEGWWRRSPGADSHSSEDSGAHMDPDQGPFQFRKILRPSSLAVANSNNNNQNNIHNHQNNRNNLNSNQKCSNVTAIKPVVTSTAAYNLKNISQQKKSVPIKSIPLNDGDSSGPYDLRRLLRKTDHAPTETWRRCKGLPLTDSRDPLVCVKITGGSVEL